MISRVLNNRMILITIFLVVIPITAFIDKGYSIMRYEQINWGKSYEENGFTNIPGSLKTESGRFQLLWKLRPDYRRLFFVNAGGTEEKLYLLFPDKDTAIIYREQSPLKNSNEFPELKMFAVVKTQNLSAVLEPAFQYREPAYDPAVKLIQWNSAYRENGFTLVPGTVKTYFGTFNFYIKLSPGSIPQLITMIAAGSAEIKPLEEKLFLLRDPDKGTITILKERIPLLNSPDPPALQKIVTVGSANFNEWLNLDQKERD